MFSRLHAALLLSTVLLAACDTSREDWQRAEAADSAQAYKAFLTRHPESPLAEQARARLERLEMNEDWARAERADTIPAYERYLRKYPRGEHAAAAHERIIALRRAGAFEAALVADNPNALRAFLREHPGEPEAELARARLAAIESGGAAKGGSAATPAAAGAKSPPPAAGALAAAAGETATHRIQLGAFRSADGAAAERERLLQAHGGLVGGLDIATAPSDGLHRIRTAPMPRDTARQLCERVIAAGDDCLVVPR